MKLDEIRNAAILQAITQQRNDALDFISKLRGELAVVNQLLTCSQQDAEKARKDLSEMQVKYEEMCKLYTNVLELNEQMAKGIKKPKNKE